MLLKISKILIIILVAAAAGILFFTSCQKELNGNTNGNGGAPAGMQKVSVYLNDDPDFNFTKVLVDIRLVEVKVDTGATHHDDDFFDDDDDGDDDHHDHDRFGQWDTLNVQAGVYDLLRLRNGIDTLVASGFANNGHISKIRFTLGTNNSVWTDSIHSFPLTICDQKPFFYVKVRSNTIDTIPGGGVRINIDFDVSKSIKKKDNGFCLRPELKAFSKHESGELEGKVLPKDANASVTVFNATDTAHAIPDHEGEWEIRGLKDGTYAVLFDGTAPYNDTTINNIVVRKNEDTKVPTVTLHK